MKKLIRLVVTQKDINTGKKSSCYHCPIAQSATRHFNREASATASGIYVHNGVCDSDYYEPVNYTRYQGFINAFDSGHKVVPSVFYFQKV